MQLWMEWPAIIVCRFNFLFWFLQLLEFFSLLCIFVSPPPFPPLKSSWVHVFSYMLILCLFGPTPHDLLTQVLTVNYILALVSLSTHPWEALTASIRLRLDKALPTLASIHRMLFSQWMNSLDYIFLLHHVDLTTEIWGNLSIKCSTLDIYSILLCVGFIVLEKWIKDKDPVPSFLERSRIIGKNHTYFLVGKDL